MYSPFSIETPKSHHREGGLLRTRPRWYVRDFIHRTIKMFHEETLFIKLNFIKKLNFRMHLYLQMDIALKFEMSRSARYKGKQSRNVDHDPLASTSTCLFVNDTCSAPDSVRTTVIYGLNFRRYGRN